MSLGPFFRPVHCLPKKPLCGGVAILVGGWCVLIVIVGDEGRHCQDGGGDGVSKESCEEWLKFIFELQIT